EETPKEFANVLAQEKKEGIKEESKATIPELKEISPHLNHAFLGEDFSYLAIISSELSLLEEEKLVRVAPK
ncbi:hypothetical protein A2U01_0094465, partial [Trifolium medium]|nr:hypothetical protein [Trifolium medium]